LTLLSIVGDDISRIIPLLYAYKGEIKQHVLLCDDDPSNYARAKTLQKGMQKFSAQNSLGWYIKIISIDEDSAEDIKTAAHKQFERSGELWLNATDGYPAMTILLSELVRKEGGKILSYDHFDNDLHVIEPDGSMRTEKLKSNINIESYLTLLNYNIKMQSSSSELLPRKKYVLELYKKESLFKKVRNAVVAKALGQPYDFDLSMAKDMLETLRHLKIVDEHYNLIRNQQKVLQGDLLEEYMFWLCEALNPDDIMMGVKIDFEDEKSEPHAQYRVMNEFDILMMHNNRIYTVECKFSQHLEGLEIIYKYDAIIDYFGKASKAIIVNISSKPKESYLGSKVSGNFKHSTLRRARLAGVSVYHESQVNVIKFQNLVRNFFHIK
jgi:hypothetical protein